MPAILLYNLNGEKGRRIRGLCLRLRVRIQNVSPAEHGETLAALTGRAERANVPCESPFADEMLVFVDFDNGLLNRFLEESRRAKCTVALKAVLTPTNLNWTSLQLCEEISRERAALQGRRPAPADKQS